MEGVKEQEKSNKQTYLHKNKNKNKNNNKMSYLESVPTAGKSVKSFMDDFLKGENDVQKILGKPSFTTVKQCWMR